MRNSIRLLYYTWQIEGAMILNDAQPNNTKIDIPNTTFNPSNESVDEPLIVTILKFNDYRRCQTNPAAK